MVVNRSFCSSHAAALAAAHAASLAAALAASHAAAHAGQAKDAFKELKVGLQRHIVWEEELLFPMWEEKTGMIEYGPTPVMRFEHEQIKQLLDANHRKVESQDLNSDHEEQALLNLLGSHNRKEEKALYPAIDNVTNADERDTIFTTMKTIPEDQGNACCSGH